MHVEWTEAEHQAGVDAASDARADDKDPVLAAMNVAVELFLARASGQVPKDLAEIRRVFDGVDWVGRGREETEEGLARLAALAQEAETLRKSVAELKAELCEETERLERIEAALVEEREDALAEVERLKATVADYEQGAEHLRRLLSSARAEVERLKKEWDQERALRCDDLAALAHDKQRATAAESEVERLKEVKALFEELEAIARRDRERAEARAKVAEFEVERLKARVDSLREDLLKQYDDLTQRAAQSRQWWVAQRDAWADRGMAAESRLAAIRGRVASLRMSLDSGDLGMADDAFSDINSHVEDLEAALECDAPNHSAGLNSSPESNSPGFPDGSPNPSMPSNDSADAATPGHPERVKERSEAVEWSVRRPENDSDTFITIDNGVEGTMPITRTQLERYADKRAEAMRAACLDAVQRVIQTLALGPTEREMFMAAIKGATP